MPIKCIGSQLKYRMSGIKIILKETCVLIPVPTAHPY